MGNNGARLDVSDQSRTLSTHGATVSRLRTWECRVVILYDEDRGCELHEPRQQDHHLDQTRERYCYAVVAATTPGGTSTWAQTWPEKPRHNLRVLVLSLFFETLLGLVVVRFCATQVSLAPVIGKRWGSRALPHERPSRIG